MDKRRKNQLILLIVLNLTFFFVLDFISPTPVVFDAPETPPGFMVTYESHVKMKWRSFLIYPSEIEYSAFKPIEKQIENREYGKFIQYKVEFLEEIAGKNSFQENIQAAASMDARIMIGGDSENDIRDAMSYLEEYEIILISPFISIDRDKIDSGLVLSLLPNSTEKMRLYSELLCQEKIDALIVLSDRSTSQKIADFYDINEVIFLNQVSMLNETLTQWNKIWK